MKKLLLLLMPFLLGACINGQDNFTNYPKYEIVVKTFFENYNLSSDFTDDQLKFEKRKNGWYICLYDIYNSNTKLKEDLFWNKGVKQFIRVPYEKAASKNENTALLDKFQDNWSKMNYDICPYFGYPAWDEDVIADFGKLNDLSDTNLYALGRAYSSYANNLLNDNSGLSNKKERFNLPETKNSLNPEQLEKYRTYRHLAIDKFKLLNNHNPSFNTIVGSILIKASNEHLTSFLDLCIYQNEEEAKKELKANLYNTFHIASAKNYLNSCDSNAILFTAGDNDTYPLLYVQAQYGIRTDVLVVNTSLLQTSRYINYLRTIVLDAQPLPLSYPQSLIMSEKRDVIYIQGETLKAKTLSDIIQFTKEDKNMKTINDNHYYYVPTKLFKFNRKEKVLEWDYPSSYIMRNHLIMLDVIAQNNWKRPLCFVIASGDDNFLGLSAYMQIEGLVYSLTANETIDELQNNVNAKAVFKRLMKTFDWSGITNLTVSERQMCENYMFTFHHLANHYIQNQQLDSAKIVLDKCLEILPNEKAKFGFVSLHILEDYLKIKNFKQANAIAIALTNNLKNKNVFELEEEKRLKAVISIRFKEMAKQYNQKKLLELIEN